MSTTGTKRKTTDTEGGPSDITAVGHKDPTEPLPKKSKSEAGTAVAPSPVVVTGSKNSEKANSSIITSKIAELVNKLSGFYEILPPLSPELVKDAVVKAQSAGFTIPIELEAYFMACNGFKKKDEDTEVLFFGLKSIIDTERDDELNGCLVEQIEEDEISDDWKESDEQEPIDPIHTKKGVLIGSGGEDTNAGTYIYMICDPKSSFYSKIVSKSDGFMGTKLVHETFVDTLAKLADHISNEGHIDSLNIFIPDLRGFDDGEIEDQNDDDYKENDDEENN